MHRKTLLLQSTIVPVIALFSLLPVQLSSQITGTYFKQYQAKTAENADVVVVGKKLDRVEALEKFFERLNSPLKAHAATFVEVADKYNIDYKLLPAISCMESSCGKNLIEGSYNPFGWGIYGNNAIHFKNYDEAIEVVGKGIAENYINKGYDTVEEIAPIYTPPNHRNWRNGVAYFIDKMQESEENL